MRVEVEYSGQEGEVCVTILADNAADEHMMGIMRFVEMKDPTRAFYCSYGGQVEQGKPIRRLEIKFKHKEAA